MVLGKQDLPCTYLAHHELESVIIIIIITLHLVSECFCAAYASVCRVLIIPIPLKESANHQRNAIKVLIHH